MTMNREIIFRGKNPNGEWVSGDLILVIEEEPHIFYKTQEDIINERISNETVVKETVGQYTDLTDKNGNKIFEGDIVEFTNLDLPNMVIRFDNGSFMLCEDEYSTYEELRMNYVVEVIGNIHDNPELLKG